jgi:hypothetical protein
VSKALEDGDFDAYDKLEERYNKLINQQAPVAPQAPVVDDEPVEEDESDVEVDEELADMDC